MSTLRTNYQDDILDTSVNLRRKYLVTENEDGSVSLEDVTEYTQNGDVISAQDINAINGQVNTNTGEIDTIENTTIPAVSNRVSTLEDTTVPAIAGRVSTLEDTTIPAINNSINTGLATKVNKPTGGDGSSGQVLKTNGDGTTFWDNEATGGGSSPLESSNTTTFGTNTITQTFTNGNTLTTTFNSNGTITEVFVDSQASTTTTNVTTFNSDGSISVVSTTT